MKKKYPHGFIGLGKMAQILVKSFLSKSLIRPNQIVAYRRNQTELKKIAKKLKIQTTSTLESTALNSQILWMGIKPFQAHAVLEEIKTFISPNTVVISMMAGIPTGFIRKILGRNSKIIRIMPNTPTLVGEGMTGVFFSRSVDKKIQKVIKGLLNATGRVEFFQREKDLDAVTGLSGSGPAFIYALIDALIQGGVKSGLTHQKARLLSLQTVRGAIAMLQQCGQTPNQLIAEVVSKGGTTEAGLKVLKKFKTQTALAQAVTKATQRAHQISEELEKCLP